MTPDFKVTVLRLAEIDISGILVFNRCKVAKCSPEFFRTVFAFPSKEADELALRCKAVSVTGPGGPCNTTFRAFCKANAACQAIAAEQERRVTAKIRQRCGTFPVCVGPVIDYIDDPSTDSPEQAKRRAAAEYGVRTCNALTCETMKRNREDELHNIATEKEIFPPEPKEPKTPPEPKK